MAGLILRREPSETWLDAALRRAAPYGLQGEVKADYDAAVAVGCPPDEAAFHACAEWDVLESDP